MDNRRFAFFVVSEEFLNHEVESFLTGRQGSISIGPGDDLIVGNNGLEAIVVIFDVNFSDPEFLLLDFADKCEFIFSFDHFPTFSLHVGPISVTLFTILLNQATEHKDRGNVIFFYHSIKVIKR
jgi:hypothetical protein